MEHTRKEIKVTPSFIRILTLLQTWYRDYDYMQVIPQKLDIAFGKLAGLKTNNFALKFRMMVFL